MVLTFAKRFGSPVLCVFSALFIALVLAAGVEFERALADDSADGLLAVDGSTLFGENDSVTYPLWVGETQVASDNLTGSGWSFDPATKTLTLNGYNYKGAGHEEPALDDDGGYQVYRHSPIFWNDEKSAFTIQLEGENSITVTGGSEHGDIPDRYYGVFSAGDLTFKGAGSLVANASIIQQPEEGDSEAEYPEAVGIHAKHDVSIESGSISGIGHESGIESYDGIIAIGKSAGTITAKAIASSDSNLYAIYAEGGDVRIDGGSVTAIGYTGIYTAHGIVVNGGNVIAQSNVPDTYEGSIMAPSGIYSENAQVIVNGGSVNAKGFDYGIYSGYCNVKDDDDDDEDEDDGDDEGYDSSEIVINGIVVNGGSVIAEATGPNDEKISTGSGIKINGVAGGTLTVTGGSVQATASGKDGFAIDASGSVSIEKGVTSLVATGMGGAFTKDANVKNAIAGTGWTNVGGTEGETAIQVNTGGQTLNSYKKVQFPAASTKGASTAKSATAKTGDSIPSMVLVSTALEALAAAAIALTAKSRKRD